MAQQQTEIETGIENEPKASAEKEIAERLSRIEASSQSQAVLTGVMSDPDVRAVLEAKKAGRKVQLVDPDEVARTAAASADPFAGKDVDKLSSAELASIILEHSSKRSVIDFQKVLDSKLAPIMQQIGGMQQVVTKSSEEGFKNEIAKVQKENIDFEDHRGKMVELNKLHPNLKVDQLLVLARLEKGLPPTAPKPTGLASERTTGGLQGRQAGKKIEPGEVPFRNRLGEILAKQEIDLGDFGD